jgi:hypothetical protein
VSAWPCLVEGHDDHCRAVAPGETGLARKSASPSFIEIELTIALALDALQAGLDDRPFRRIDHDRHAGDVRFRGDQVEEAHHGGLAVEHASSMLMSMTWAPASTCWRAMARPRRSSAVDDQALELGEPVTLVRSPTLTNSESAPTLNGSRPDRRSFRRLRRDGTG